MDGPLLVAKAWVFSLLWVWLYRRYLQRIGPRDPEFEAWCAARPRLIEIECDPSALPAARRAIERVLGSRRRAVPASAGWPWTIHALELEVVVHDSKLHVHALSAAVLRTGDRLPRVDDLLRAAATDSGSVLEVWLHPRLYVDVTGEVEAPGGWRLRLEPGAARLPKPAAHEPELLPHSQALAGAQPPAMQLSP